MWYFVVSLPFIYIGAFTRVYTLQGRGDCFWIDGISTGAACFTNATFVPELVAYGSMVVGWAFLAAGWLHLRRRKTTA